MARDYKATIIALLTKAEDVGVDSAEGIACQERAMFLMAAHGIEDVLTAAREHSDTMTNWWNDAKLYGSYFKAKDRLYRHIVEAFRGYSIKIGKNRRHCFAYASDKINIEVTFELLTQQAMSLLDNEEIPWNENARSWRTQWWDGFTETVSIRLMQMTQAAVNEAEAAHPGTELVLVSHAEQSEAEMRNQYPNTRTLRRYVNTGDGYTAGNRAGSRVNIGQTSVGGIRAIGR